MHAYLFIYIYIYSKPIEQAGDSCHQQCPDCGDVILPNRPKQRSRIGHGKRKQGSVTRHGGLWCPSVVLGGEGREEGGDMMDTPQNRLYLFLAWGLL